MFDCDATQIGLVLVDMQNDFIHADGAYAKAGQGAASIAALPDRLAPVAETVRKAGGWVISTHFTLIPGKDGAPFISDHLRRLRPFLGTGDFAPGSFGQALIDELQPADLSVEKVAFSAFHQSRMDWVLRRAGVTTLIFGGIVTNGGVASTVRDAHVHDYAIVVLSDGCAAFSEEAHRSTLESLASIATISNCGDVIKAL